MTAEDALTQPVAALTATGVGTSGADDNQAQAGHLIACVTGDHTHALTAEGHDASEDGTGRGTPIAFHLTPNPVNGPAVPAIGAESGGQGVSDGTNVRRLTPLECERLQGAPDGWTDGQADSPRYRQLGNAVAVPVFEWVARRLVAVDATLHTKETTECLPDCDGWPCRCPCHDDATEYHSVTCMAGGFDGFDCDHPGHVSAGQPANGGNMETPPEGASTPLRRLTATASTDSPGGHHG